MIGKDQVQIVTANREVAFAILGKFELAGFKLRMLSQACMRGATYNVLAELEGEPAAPVWDGEGLPPVGTVCEYMRVRVGAKVEIFAVKPNYNGSSTALFTFEDGTWGGCAEPTAFRPIRTPEQIAADERIHKIRNACTAINQATEAYNLNVDCSAAMRAVVEAMIDEGYTK